MKMIKVLDMKKLPQEVQEKIYNKLINGDYYAEIDINTQHKYMSSVDVLIAGDRHHDSDCGLSHFGYNFYCRTNKAIKGTRYKKFTGYLAALKRLIKNYFNDLICTSNIRVYYKGIEIFVIEFYCI